MNEMNDNKKKKALSREEKALLKKMNDDKEKMKLEKRSLYFNEYSMSSHVKEIPDFTSVLNDVKAEPRIKLLEKTNE